MQIINLFIQMLQIILPFYFICFVLYIKKLLANIYIKNKKLTDKISIYNYNKKNKKNIIIINGGGLFFNDITDNYP